MKIVYKCKCGMAYSEGAMRIHLKQNVMKCSKCGREIKKENIKP